MTLSYSRLRTLTAIQPAKVTKASETKHRMLTRASRAFTAQIVVYGMQWEKIGPGFGLRWDSQSPFLSILRRA